MTTAAVPSLLHQQVDRWALDWLRSTFSRLLELRALDPGPFSYPIDVFGMAGQGLLSPSGIEPGADDSTCEAHHLEVSEECLQISDNDRESISSSREPCRPPPPSPLIATCTGIVRPWYAASLD